MIKVCDSIMGSGKTSAAITYMNEHPNERFIYATPYLTECDRIKEACPNLHFVAPSSKVSEYHFSKLNHSVSLIESGRNIVTTHQALRSYPISIADTIHENGYTLILDECIAVMKKYDGSGVDLEIAEISGLLDFDGEQVTRTDKEYSGGLFSGILNQFESGELFRIHGKEDDPLYYWFISPSIFKAFKDVIVMTYMFSGQALSYYMKIQDLDYSFIGVRCVDGTYRFCDAAHTDNSMLREIVSHLHVVMDKKLNRVGEDYYALSMHWFIRDQKRVKRLKGQLRKYFERLMTDSTSKNRLWGTYKIAVSQLKGAGYTKCHLSFNARAVNDYRSRTVLAYLANPFMNGSEVSYYYSKGVDVSQDDYALSTMLQWIWRSAIRDGEDITVWVPSRRMRDLLLNWMYSVQLGGEQRNEETEKSVC